MGPGREQADRDAAARRLRVPNGWVLAPANMGGGLLDVADEVGVEGLAAGADFLAGAEEVLAADVQAVEAEAAGYLVQLGSRDPLQVGGAEGAVGAGRAGVGVDAVRIHAGRPASGKGRGRRRRPWR